MNFPTIQIRQTPAQLGIEQKRANLNLRQPHATMRMNIEEPRIEQRQPMGDLHIDQSKAWAALGVGNHLESMSIIYSYSRNEAMQGIARIAQEGDRMMQIHNKTDAFAEIAKTRMQTNYSNINYVGEASYDNVDISFTARRPELELIRGTVNVNITPNLPEMSFQRGNINIYMLQYNSIQIIPPQIDLQV